MEKDDVQSFIYNLQKAGPGELNHFAVTFPHGNEAAWRRFIKGAYHQPITWWIGIFQLQMQMGMWGFRYRSDASTRASVLWRVTRPLRDEVRDGVKGEDMPLLSAIVQYNLKHRKADIIGRLIGGQFTSYASMGGRFGSKRLPKTGKVVGAFTNFGIASYGAGIQAVGKGLQTVEAVIQSILTGRPEHLPDDYCSNSDVQLDKEESEVLGNLESALSEVMSLTQVKPDPVPIKEFCSRPENISLKGVCR
ncbi:MAG: hypothetical protein HY308_11860 [Gammaproteobacteria bacterium]|nr:hypothetical protein [Gammaproteobacteria bacterium]